MNKNEVKLIMLQIIFLLINILILFLEIILIKRFEKENKTIK